MHARIASQNRLAVADGSELESRRHVLRCTRGTRSYRGVRSRPKHRAASALCRANGVGGRCARALGLGRRLCARMRAWRKRSRLADGGYQLVGEPSAGEDAWIGLEAIEGAHEVARWLPVRGEARGASGVAAGRAGRHASLLLCVGLAATREMGFSIASVAQPSASCALH